MQATDILLMRVLDQSWILSIFIIKLIEMSKISMTSHEEIQKHPTNNSPAKISFRFSQTKRFKDDNPECPVAFYTYSTQLSKRKSSIGSGQKSDFTKDQAKTPGGTQYNPNSYYEFTKTKGLSFGQSREKSKDKSYLIPQIHIHPGVGAYDTSKPAKMSSSYTIRSKTQDSCQKHLSYKNVPGPGSYEAVELDPTKPKTKVSKYKGPKLGVGLTSTRFLEIKDTPGPHTYKNPDDLTPTARYIISQHRGRGTRPFSLEKRFTHEYWKQSKNPGPDHYQKPSDFGKYGDSVYYKALNTVE